MELCTLTYEFTIKLHEMGKKSVKKHSEEQNPAFQENVLGCVTVVRPRAVVTLLKNLNLFLQYMSIKAGFV